jgi:hypothetical protein
MNKHYATHNLSLYRATTERAGIQLYVTAFISTIHIPEGKENAIQCIV